MRFTTFCCGGVGWLGIRRQQISSTGSLGRGRADEVWSAQRGSNRFSVAFSWRTSWGWDCFSYSVRAPPTNRLSSFLTDRIGWSFPVCFRIQHLDWNLVMAREEIRRFLGRDFVSFADSRHNYSQRSLRVP